METYKTITTSKYILQVPELWEVTDFDENKYDLAFKTQDGENYIFFNLRPFYEKLDSDPDKDFGFGRIRVNILSRPIKYSDKKYSGNIDILTENNLEAILKSIELIIMKMMLNP